MVKFQHAGLKGGHRIVIALALVALWPGLASTQVLEEIIVTAQKREQNIQNVGISITAFTGEQLASLGLVDTKDLMVFTPGLNVSGFGSSSITTFNIRGSAQNDFADHEEAPIAVYLDGSYLSALGAVGFGMFDLQRVEVLRGPQGTLFGRNATGGVIQLITNKPTDTVSGFADLQVGQYGKRRLEAAFGGPLTSTLSARISVLKNQSDGYVNNLLGDDAYDVDDTAARLQLLYHPSTDFSLLLAVRWGQTRNGPDTYYNKPGVLNAEGLAENATSSQQYSDFCLAAFGIAPGAPDQDCFGAPVFLSDIHEIATPFDSFTNRQDRGLDATLRWQLGGVNLISISDYYHMSRDYQEDISSNPFVYFVNSQTVRRYRQLSQEIRLDGATDKSNWVAGVYYLDIDGSYDLGTISPDFFLSNTDNVYSLRTKSYAAFAQDEYAITPKISLLAGVRWTVDKKAYNMDASCIEFAPGRCDLFYGGFVQNNESLALSRKETKWSGMLEVDWRPKDGLLVYAKQSRGTKAGGYNGGAILLFSADQTEFKGEVLDSTELGLKVRWWDGKARLNASAFYYDYHDFQSYVQSGASLLVFNTDAISRGGELELTLNPWTGWEFLLGASKLNADQKDVTFAGITENRPMANAPDASYNGIARYEWPAFGGTLSAQATITHVGDHYWSGVNHPALHAPSYTTADARIAFQSHDERFEVALWMKNLTNEKYFLNGFEDVPLWATNAFIPAPPRWVGGTIRYNFR
jgi:iron complex outermembrane receptor protein